MTTTLDVGLCSPKYQAGLPDRQRSRAVTDLREIASSSRTVRLASGAALTFAVAMPVLQIALASSQGVAGGAQIWDLVAVAGYLPFNLWHVRYGLRASRPPAGMATFAVMAFVILAATPFVGSYWLPTYQALIVSAVIVLPGRWSLLCTAGIAAAIAPVAIAFGETGAWAFWAACAVLCRAGALLAIILLVAALRKLQTARAALVQEAIARERRRVDSEIRESVGGELESIVAWGQRKFRDADADDGELASELQALVGSSRRALTRVRRTVRGYQTPTLRSELEAAATLLSAAGRVTRLEIPRDELSETLAAQARAVLRPQIARLLADPAGGACLIAVIRRDGKLRLEVHVEGESAPMVKVLA